MRRLDERSDDALLSAEEALEEKLESMDYDVWLCDTCGRKEIVPVKRWMSKYEQCPKCHRRTCAKIETVVQKPTYDAGGTKRVRRSCKNCAFSDERDVPIPRLTRSASGSSGGGFSSGGGGGGGSSFGGGSSGGGGAGRSY